MANNGDKTIVRTVMYEVEVDATLREIISAKNTGNAISGFLNLCGYLLGALPIPIPATLELAGWTVSRATSDLEGLQDEFTLVHLEMLNDKPPVICAEVVQDCVYVKQGNNKAGWVLDGKPTIIRRYTYF